MANVLSQQQIDELLGNLRSGELDIDEVEQQQTAQKVKEYDFRSPRKVTKEQLKYLTSIFDSFASFFSMNLTSVLRQNCQIEILQIEEEEYKEFNNALEDSVLVGMFSVNGENVKYEDEQILVEVSKPLSFAIMELLLGGSVVSSQNITRDYTEIELSIMEYLFKMMPQNLNKAWSNYLEVEHSLEVVETNSRIIQFVPNDVTIAIIVMEISIHNVKGIMNVCVPAPLFEKLLPLMDNRNLPKKGDDKLDEQKISLLSSIKKTSLEITGVLGSTDIQIHDLLELQQGDIIILNERKISDDVEIMIEGNHWFTGTVGIKNKNYAVQINNTIN
ncbi:MAG: flagellar motor switch protein FliM [Oscillospiraceae bacterium]